MSSLSLQTLFLSAASNSSKDQFNESSVPRADDAMKQTSKEQYEEAAAVDLEDDQDDFLGRTLVKPLLHQKGMIRETVPWESYTDIFIDRKWLHC